MASKTAGVSSKYEQYLNPDWVEPHAWAAEKDPLQQLCPAVAECSTDYDKRNVEVALKKLVYSLFDRSKFVVRIVVSFSAKILFIQMQTDKLRIFIVITAR